MPVYNTPQKLAAEFLGTFALVFFGEGAICAEQFLHGAGGMGLLGIALAHGLAIGVMVCAIGHVSGGHFNPAVTMAFWVTKRLNTFEVFGYWIAQIVGAVAAAFFLKAVLPREEAWLPVLGGTPDLARDFTRLPAIGLEGIATFFLVFVVFAAAVDKSSSARPYAGLCIGITITLGILCSGRSREGPSIPRAPSVPPWRARIGPTTECIGSARWPAASSPGSFTTFCTASSSSNFEST